MILYDIVLLKSIDVEIDEVRISSFSFEREAGEREVQELGLDEGREARKVGQDSVAHAAERAHGAAAHDGGPRRPEERGLRESETLVARGFAALTPTGAPIRTRLLL